MPRKSIESMSADERRKRKTIEGICNILWPGVAAKEHTTRLAKLCGVGASLVGLWRAGSSGMTADTRATVEEELKKKAGQDRVMAEAVKNLDLDCIMSDRGLKTWESRKAPSSNPASRSVKSGSKSGFRRTPRRSPRLKAGSRTAAAAASSSSPDPKEIQPVVAKSPTASVLFGGNKVELLPGVEARIVTSESTCSLVIGPKS